MKENGWQQELASFPKVTTISLTERLGALLRLPSCPEQLHSASPLASPAALNIYKFIFISSSQHAASAGESNFIFLSLVLSFVHSINNRMCSVLGMRKE